MPQIKELTNLAGSHTGGVSQPLCRITFDDGKVIEKSCVFLPTNFLIRILRDEHTKPESQDDWKAINWSYGGPKPSKTKEFYVHIDRVNYCCYLISIW